MTENEFKNLGTGDIIRHVGTKETFLIVDNYGKRITAVKTVDITNPNEWDLILIANYKEPERN